MSQLYLETMAVFSYNADITCLKKIEQTGCKGDGLMYDMTPYLKKIDEVIEKGPYKDTWESLSQYHTPDWYQMKKFGIFSHWAIYCVPAFGN